MIEAKNTDSNKLFWEINRKLKQANIPTESEPYTIYLSDSVLEDIVKEIIQIAKINNYAIFYRLPSDYFYSLTKIYFIDEGYIENINNFSPLETKNLEEGKSLDFWLEFLTDGNFRNREEALKIVATILGPGEKNIFLDSLDSFIKDADDPRREGEFDGEMVKNIARDMLQEFLIGIPKPAYGR